LFVEVGRRPSAAVGGDQQALGVRIASAVHLRPPASDRVDRESSSVVIDADAHPSGVVGDVIDAVRNARPSSGMTKSCTRTSSGQSFSPHSRPVFLKSPTTSFFLVSMEIAGSPGTWQGIYLFEHRRAPHRREIAAHAIGA
jgi:thiamine phosphate synthase YjbQ (UPF0047 family)